MTGSPTCLANGQLMVVMTPPVSSRKESLWPSTVTGMRMRPSGEGSNLTVEREHGDVSAASASQRGQNNAKANVRSAVICIWSRKARSHWTFLDALLHHEQVGGIKKGLVLN